jgi:hypothetical protein
MLIRKNCFSFNCLENSSGAEDWLEALHGGAMRVDARVCSRRFSSGFYSEKLM